MLIKHIMACVAFVIAMASCKIKKSSSFLNEEGDDEYPYKEGYDDPVITPDKGAGEFSSEAPTIAQATKREAVLQYAIPAAAQIIGQDAADHLKHFFDQTGSPYTARVDHLITECTLEKDFYKALLKDMIQEVNDIPNRVDEKEAILNKTLDITSKKSFQLYCYKEDSPNWYFATGGHSVWGKARFVIKRLGDDKYSYLMAFEYRYFDRYNWDKGKEVEIGGVKILDDDMGRFHRMGLAQEFTLIGSDRRPYHWVTGDNLQGVFQQWPDLLLTEKDLKVLSMFSNEQTPGKTFGRESRRPQ